MSWKINLNLSIIGLGIVKIGLLTLIKLMFIIIFIIILLYLLYVEHYEDPRIYLFSNEVEDNHLKAGFLNEVKKVGSSIVVMLGFLSSAATIKSYMDDESLKIRERKIEQEELRLKAEQKILTNEYNKLELNEQLKNKWILDKSRGATDVMYDGYRQQLAVDTCKKELEDLKGTLENVNLSVFEKEVTKHKIDQKESLLLEKQKYLSSTTNELLKIKTDWEKSVQPSINKDESLSTTPGSTAPSGTATQNNSGSGGNIFSPDEDILRIPINLIQNLFISILLLNSIVFSCIVSIIFTLFGDYLIEKYSLDKRWPRFAKFIALRRKFQSYYLKLNIILIIILVLLQIWVSIYIIMI